MNSIGKIKTCILRFSCETHCYNLTVLIIMTLLLFRRIERNQTERHDQTKTSWTLCRRTRRIHLPISGIANVRMVQIIRSAIQSIGKWSHVFCGYACFSGNHDIIVWRNFSIHQKMECSASRLLKSRIEALTSVERQIKLGKRIHKYLQSTSKVWLRTRLNFFFKYIHVFIIITVTFFFFLEQQWFINYAFSLKQLLQTHPIQTTYCHWLLTHLNTLDPEIWCVFSAPYQMSSSTNWNGPKPEICHCRSGLYKTAVYWLWTVSDLTILERTFVRQCRWLQVQSNQKSKHSSMSC